jgi:16S rRNA processing protein RimM
MANPQDQPGQEHEQPEAGRQPASDPAFLVLGRILRPHGVRGEMLLQIITQFPERIADLGTVFIGTDPHDPASAAPFAVASTRQHRGQLLIRLDGIADRNEAELCRNKLLMVALDDAVPLAEDEYYQFQVIGAEVVTADGESLGQIDEILETGANDVFVVRGGLYGEVLIPDIDDVILDVDIEHQIVTINPLPGLLPD